MGKAAPFWTQKTSVPGPALPVIICVTINVSNYRETGHLRQPLIMKGTSSETQWVDQGHTLLVGETRLELDMFSVRKVTHHCDTNKQRKPWYCSCSWHLQVLAFTRCSPHCCLLKTRLWISDPEEAGREHCLGVRGSGCEFQPRPLLWLCDLGPTFTYL